MVSSSMMSLLTLSDYYTIFTPVNKAKTTSRWNRRALVGSQKEAKKESGTEISNSLEFDFVVPPPHS